MTPAVVLLMQVFAIVVVPCAALTGCRLRGVIPLVVMQILVGIALGPSVLGRLAPGISMPFLNRDALLPLSGIASIAVLLFGFITGLHFEPITLRARRGAFAGIAFASFAVPTLSGTLAGFWLALRHPGELTANVDPLAFAMAIGVCTGITALPVLSAILREMDLLGSRIGQIALGIAAINDGALWICLGLVMAAVTGRSSGVRSALAVLAIVPCHVAAMAGIARPLLRRMAGALAGDERPSESVFIAVYAVAIGSALVTEALGLHYLLGAFIAGAIVPRELRRPIIDRLQPMTIGVLMPFFFALVGLRTSINFASSDFFEIFAVATAAAVIGKLGGTALAARLAGESWPEALGLGALVQTKGLMEVVVLTILLDNAIISPQVFSALILMALATTALAAPLARAVMSQHLDRPLKSCRQALRAGNAVQLE